MTDIDPTPSTPAWSVVASLGALVLVMLVGMRSLRLELAGLVYGAYMLHFEGPLQGHVGVIGATATIGVFIVIAIERLTQRLRPATAIVPG